MSLTLFTNKTEDVGIYSIYLTERSTITEYTATTRIRLKVYVPGAESEFEEAMVNTIEKILEPYVILREQY